MTASYFLLVLISSSLRVPDAMIPEGINGKYDITLDEIPKTFELDVLDKNEHLTKLHLWPSWEKQKLRFNIGNNDYNLEYGIECATHYYGEKCDVFCHPWHDTHFTCSDAGEKICDSGWMGENCTQQMNPCENSPCLNGGRCEAVNGVVFTCSCDGGFEGMLCDRRKRISTTTSTTPRQTSERTTTSSTTASTTMKSVSSATVLSVSMEKKQIISVVVEGTAEEVESDGTATKLVIGLLALLFICLLAIILILFYRKRTSSSAAKPTSVVVDSTCSKEKKDSKNSSSPERPESPRYSNPPWMKKGSSLELPSPPVIPAPTPSLKISSNPLDV